MSTENERERAQLERVDDEDQAEIGLVVVEVVARNEAGDITQFRRFREATDAEAQAILDKRKGNSGL